MFEGAVATSEAGGGGGGGGGTRSDPPSSAALGAAASELAQTHTFGPLLRDWWAQQVIS